jgi:DNA-binding MarR family transcriptional regulator
VSKNPIAGRVMMEQMKIMRVRPTPEQEEILRTVYRWQKISPGHLSAETLIPPDKVMPSLQKLVKAGLVLIAPDDSTPDRRIVFLTREGREYAYSMISQESSI